MPTNELQTVETQSRFVGWVMKHKMLADVALFGIGVTSIDVGVGFAIEGQYAGGGVLATVGVGACYAAYDFIRLDSQQHSDGTHE